MDKEPITPSLNPKRDIGFEGPEQKAFYLIEFFMNNPGFVSDLNPDEAISFRKLESEFGADRDALALSAETQLNEALRFHWPNGELTASVEVDNVTETSFNLLIKISDQLGVPVTGINSVITSDGQLTVQYDKIKL